MQQSLPSQLLFDVAREHVVDDLSGNASCVQFDNLCRAQPVKRRAVPEPGDDQLVAHALRAHGDDFVERWWRRAIQGSTAAGARHHARDRECR